MILDNEDILEKDLNIITNNPLIQILNLSQDITNDYTQRTKELLQSANKIMLPYIDVSYGTSVKLYWEINKNNLICNIVKSYLNCQVNEAPEILIQIFKSNNYSLFIFLNKKYTSYNFIEKFKLKYNLELYHYDNERIYLRTKSL